MQLIVASTHRPRTICKQGMSKQLFVAHAVPAVLVSACWDRHCLYLQAALAD
jgi:hypothetical protein